MEFIKDIHYYMDDVRVVFTALYHVQRGECCGGKCRHCPFEPKYQKGNVVVAEEFSNLKDNLENGNG